MKSPVILAHGQQVLAFILAVGVGAIAISLAALVAGFRKKNDKRSVSGLVCSSLGIMVGGFLCFLHGAEPPYFDFFSVIMLSPLPLALVALFLSLRRKAKNA